MSSIVWSLLRRNISKGQLFGYAIANVVGLSVILIGILFYCDSQNSSDINDKYFSNDFIVVSKRVDGIGLTPIHFSEEEIKDIERQPWAKKVGRFTASRFAVSGSIEMGGRGLSTYLFLESVPDEFFDIKPVDWDFSPEEKFVPVILCKDYLTLYNFGFAVPQGLPQISEAVVGAIPVTLRLTGENMQHEYFDCSVVGFSSRLNTIAVPQKFMDWANARYSRTNADGTPADDYGNRPGEFGGKNKGKAYGTSSLIIETDRFDSDAMHEYIAAHNLEIAGDKGEAGNIASFLGVVSAVVTTNGFVICLLAMFILILSIFLILQKSREKLRNLMLLGYHPRQVARCYERLVIIANIAITLLSLGMTFFARTLWADQLLAIGLGGASIIPTLIFALTYIIGVTTLDIIIIRRRLMQIWLDR